MIASYPGLPDMIEYIFFEATLRDKFLAYAAQRDVPCTATEDHMGMVVAVPEDLPDALADELEGYYETLEQEQEGTRIAEGDLHRLAGFGFTCPTGKRGWRPFPPVSPVAC